MRTRAFITATGIMFMALVMSITSGSVMGQTMYDRITVNLPYSVSVGDRTLPPGDYVIQQLRDMGGGSRVLLFYSVKGMKFETSAMTIPALDPNTARDTKLIIDRDGDNFYMDKIWVQGKDYGYEFPLPANVKSRQKELQQASIPGRYESTSTPATTAENTAPPPTPPAATAPVETPKPAETAQNQTPTQQPATQPMPQPTTPPVTQPAQPDSNSANREAEDQANESTPKTMPATAAGWLTMLLGGGALSGAGWMLRRKR